MTSPLRGVRTSWHHYVCRRQTVTAERCNSTPRKQRLQCKPSSAHADYLRRWIWYKKCNKKHCIYILILKDQFCAPPSGRVMFFSVLWPEKFDTVFVRQSRHVHKSGDFFTRSSVHQKCHVQGRFVGIISTSTGIDRPWSTSTGIRLLQEPPLVVILGSWNGIRLWRGFG